MRTHHHDEGDKPCQHMEGLLNRTADGTAKGWQKWYAIAHAARCKRCGRFLDRLRVILGGLRSAKPDPEPDVMARLKQGRWRQEIAPERGETPPTQPPV
jgi:hypothetical protein